MVSRLKARDIRDEYVLNAMTEVPRHFFWTLHFWSLLTKIMPSQLVVIKQF